MPKLSEHFTVEEMRCGGTAGPCPLCGGKCDIKPALLEVLESIREFSGVPIIITSGYRCAAHNATLPDASPNSAHLTGEAADFFVSGNKDRFKFIEAIAFYGPVRYGLGSDFIHVDVSSSLPTEVCWLYGGKE
jgi:uncharacterized protein YcbK (DUF882 family)